LLGRLLTHLLAGLALSACAATVSAEQSPAAIDQAQLQLDYQAFDAAGWRELLPRGCGDAAVA